MALITPEQFRTSFPQLEGEGEDDRLTEVIAEADALMALFCGWPRTNDGFFTLEIAEYTAFLDPRIDNASVLDIPHGFPTEIESVSIDPAWLDDLSASYGAGSVVPSTAYSLDSDARELWLASNATPYSRWSSVPRANRIKYFGGLTSTPMPFDVVWLASTAARHLLDMPWVGSNQSVSQGGESYSRADVDAFLPAAVRRALAPYIVWSSRVG